MSADQLVLLSSYFGWPGRKVSPNTGTSAVRIWICGYSSHFLPDFSNITFSLFLSFFILWTTREWKEYEASQFWPVMGSVLGVGHGSGHGAIVGSVMRLVMWSVRGSLILIQCLEDQNTKGGTTDSVRTRVVIELPGQLKLKACPFRLQWSKSDAVFSSAAPALQCWVRVSNLGGGNFSIPNWSFLGGSSWDWVLYTLYNVQLLMEEVHFKWTAEDF